MKNNINKDQEQFIKLEEELKELKLIRRIAKFPSNINNLVLLTKNSLSQIKI